MSNANPNPEGFLSSSSGYQGVDKLVGLYLTDEYKAKLAHCEYINGISSRYSEAMDGLSELKARLEDTKRDLYNESFPSRIERLRLYRVDGYAQQIRDLSNKQLEAQRTIDGIIADIAKSEINIFKIITEGQKAGLIFDDFYPGQMTLDLIKVDLVENDTFSFMVTLYGLLASSFIFIPEIGKDLTTLSPVEFALKYSTIAIVQAAIDKLNRDVLASWRAEKTIKNIMNNGQGDKSRFTLRDALKRLQFLD